MIRAIAPGDMLELERRFMDETGTPAILLMERAATAVADALGDAKRVLFLCGSGGNGGDGIAAARLFAARGGDAVVWKIGSEESDIVKQQILMLKCYGASVLRITSAVPAPPPVDCVVDAMFGIGLSKPLTGAYADAVKRINAARPARVIAVDIPSGVDGATGSVCGQAITADETITFHRPKTGHYIYPGREHTGKLTVAPIGIPLSYGVSRTDPVLLEDGDIERLLPPRKPDTHKGDYGNAMIIAGGAGMAGAAALCARAAMRSGAGRVTVVCPSSIQPIVHQIIPEATAFHSDDDAECLAKLEGTTCAAVGPGLSGKKPRMLELLQGMDIPQVWDAGALNYLAEEGRRPHPRTIITPHMGEAGRLLNKPARELASDPIAAARQLNERTGAVALLKGSTTVITDGESVTLNINGSPAMAKGGMGDALAGVIAAMLAQGLAPYDAARVGAYLHGRAGSRAASALGERSVLASDVIDYL